MAKKANAKETVEDEVQMSPEEQAAKLAALQGLDEGDEELAAAAVEVDPFESIPHVYPGKPGCEKGKTFKGTFVRTKRIFSDKFNNPKIDPVTGDSYRDLHIFHNTKKDIDFGIWSVGKLGAIMRGVQPGAYLEVTYLGQEGQPLKKNQDPPHEFAIKGCNADGSKLRFDWDAPKTAPAATAASPQARQ